MITTSTVDRDGIRLALGDKVIVLDPRNEDKYVYGSVRRTMIGLELVISEIVVYQIYEPECRFVGQRYGIPGKCLRLARHTFTLRELASKYGQGVANATARS